MKKYKSIKITEESYHKILHLQYWLLNRNGITISKSSLLNFLIEKGKTTFQGDSKSVKMAK